MDSKKQKMDNNTLIAVVEQVKYIAKTVDRTEQNLENLRKEIRDGYVSNNTLKQHAKEVEGRIKPLEQIVYGAIKLVLTVFGLSLIGLVIPVVII